MSFLSSLPRVTVRSDTSAPVSPNTQLASSSPSPSPSSPPPSSSSPECKSSKSVQFYKLVFHIVQADEDATTLGLIRKYPTLFPAMHSFKRSDKIKQRIADIKATLKAHQAGTGTLSAKALERLKNEQHLLRGKFILVRLMEDKKATHNALFALDRFLVDAFLYEDKPKQKDESADDFMKRKHRTLSVYYAISLAFEILA